MSIETNEHKCENRSISELKIGDNIKVTYSDLHNKENKISGTVSLKYTDNIVIAKKQTHALTTINSSKIINITHIKKKQKNNKTLKQIKKYFVNFAKALVCYTKYSVSINT